MLMTQDKGERKNISRGFLKHWISTILQKKQDTCTNTGPHTTTTTYCANTINIGDVI